jgi:hypothetical protein
MPMFEGAFRVAPGHEITIGGDSVVGWRGTF